MMHYVDYSMMYHLIRGQSVIKLYIIYNMLEVSDGPPYPPAQPSHPCTGLVRGAAQPEARQYRELSCRSGQGVLAFSTCPVAGGPC